MRLMPLQVSLNGNFNQSVHFGDMAFEECFSQIGPKYLITVSRKYGHIFSQYRTPLVGFGGFQQPNESQQ